MDSLMAYLSNEALSTNSNGLKLQIETLHLWCVVTHYGLGFSVFKYVLYLINSFIAN